MRPLQKKIFIPGKEKLGEKMAKDLEVDTIHVNTKSHRKAGNRFSYSTQVRVEMGGKVVSQTAEDWKFRDTVHEAFDKLTKKVKTKKRGFVSRIFKRLR